mgnify:CR=1 FL=1
MKVEMKIKIIYYSVCYHGSTFVFQLLTGLVSHWSVNGQTLGTFVKVANENSFSTDDEGGRRVLYFTNICFINIWSRSISKFLLSSHQFSLILSYRLGDETRIVFFVSTKMMTEVIKAILHNLNSFRLCRKTESRDLQ